MSIRSDLDTFVRAYNELITGPGAALLTIEDVQTMLDDESYFLLPRESPDAIAFDDGLRRALAGLPEIIEEQRIYLVAKFKETLQENLNARMAKMKNSPMRSRNLS